MNLLTKARVAFNQGRLAWRKAGLTKPVRNLYEAGRWTSGDRSWIWSFVTDARFDATQASRWEMMRKARYFEQNSFLIQKLADVWELFTVGNNGIVCDSDSSDEEWNQRADDWLDEWAMAPDLASRMELCEMEQLASRLWFVDGEVFLLKTRTMAPPYRPRIQIIESHRVATPTNMKDAEGRSIFDGVQVDRKGRPIFYFVRSDFDGENYEQVPAENLIHIFEPSRAGMLRGLTHLYAAMNPLHDLDDLMRLEMYAAKEAAQTTKVIKTESGELPDDDLDEQSNHTAIDPATGRETNPSSTFYKREFGGETKVLFKGDEYEQFLSNRPTVSQQWYWRFVMEQVCTAVGIPISMALPETIGGTSQRAVLDQAAIFFSSRSGVMARVKREVRNYAVDFGSRYDVRIADKPEDWRMVSTTAPRSPNVDVGYNSKALLDAIEGGISNFQDAYGPLGFSFRRKLRQKARELSYIRRMAKEFGVEPQQISSFAAPTPEPKPDKSANVELVET